MNNLIIVVGITIVSLLFASPFLLQTQNIYEHEAYGQGYNIVEIKDSKAMFSRTSRRRPLTVRALQNATNASTAWPQR